MYHTKKANILWQNGPHKVVNNYNGTISAWIDCDQIDWSQSNIVAEMPRGKKLTGIREVIFRNFGCYPSDQKLAEKFSAQAPMISPFFQAKINEIFPEFADSYPNGNHWKNSDDCWRYITFNHGGIIHGVCLDRNGRDWSGKWWFPGLRK